MKEEEKKEEWKQLWRLTPRAHFSFGLCGGKGLCGRVNQCVCVCLYLYVSGSIIDEDHVLV